PRRVERLPVVDDGGHLVGIVTRGGLLSVFRRPDAEIRGEVIEEVLVRTLWLAPRAIGVDVHQGVVVLSGTVQRRSEAALAVRLAGRVDGVVSVVDQLGYQEDDSHLRPSEQALRGITEEWIRKL
ncbi:CBS domain protein, partial [Streptomyces varsoviensis]